MSEEQRLKVQEARRISDTNGGFAAAIVHLYGPNIRRAK